METLSFSQQSQGDSSLFINIIVSFIVPIAVLVIGALIYDHVKSRKKVSVKQIKKSTDQDIESFIELYNKTIDDDLRIDSAEVIKWIDEDRKLRKLKTHTYHHYLLIGKLGKNVVTFLKAMYCSVTQYMFIAYYGIDKSAEKARILAAPAIIKSLQELIKNEIKNCKAIICEVEAPNPKLDKEENKERKSRIRLFKETAKRRNYKLYEIGIDYLQPQMEIQPSEVNFSEVSMLLLYAPINDPKPINGRLSKEKVLEILRFVYLQIYRPTYRHDFIKDITYQSYLKSLLELYEGILPDYVVLKD